MKVTAEVVDSTGARASASKTVHRGEDPVRRRHRSVQHEPVIERRFAAVRRLVGTPPRS